MGWLIAGLLCMMALVALAVFARGWGHSHPPADDTLVADLLGPRPARMPWAPQVREARARPAPAPPPRETAPPPPEHPEPPPQPAGPPAQDGDWLETQLAWITAWSKRMHEDITSAGERPGDPGSAAGPPPAAARDGRDRQDPP